MELFNEYEALTKEADQLESDVLDALTPIFIKWHDMGYKGREIAIVMHQLVSSIEAIVILRNAINKRKAKLLTV